MYKSCQLISPPPQSPESHILQALLITFLFVCESVTSGVFCEEPEDKPFNSFSPAVLSLILMVLKLKVFKKWIVVVSTKDN